MWKDRAEYGHFCPYHSFTQPECWLASRHNSDLDPEQSTAFLMEKVPLMPMTEYPISMILSGEDLGKMTFQGIVLS